MCVVMGIQDNSRGYRMITWNDDWMGVLETRPDETGVNPGYRDLVMAIHCLSVGVPIFENVEIVL